MVYFEGVAEIFVDGVVQLRRLKSLLSSLTDSRIVLSWGEDMRKVGKPKKNKQVFGGGIPSADSAP